MNEIDKCSVWCADALSQLINKYNLKEIVELGTYTGDCLISLLSAVNGIHITCVDAWDDTFKFPDKMQYPNCTFQNITARLQDNGYNRIGLFDWNNKRNTVTLQRTDTYNSHLLHNKVDLVYIDATHTYDGCKHDILSWIGKLNSPGFLCGHDYTHQFDGVKRAVNDVLGPITETPKETFIDEVDSYKLLLIHLYTMWIKKI
jgi:hypothetical protein